MISIGIQNKTLYVVVEGRGTAEYCADLDKCMKKIISQTEIDRVLFDTSKATYLDSSFIGVILSVKKRLPNIAEPVMLLNPSEKIVEIFQIMGLDTFVPAVYDNTLCCRCDIEVDRKMENSISDFKLLLDSHRNIMETSSENHKRFALVEKVFQKELEQRQFSN